MKKDFVVFDAADYLQDEDVMLEYLRAAREDQNPAVFLIAVDDVLRRIAADKENCAPK
jgi:DNA-binding phage protein